MTGPVAVARSDSQPADPLAGSAGHPEPQIITDRSRTMYLVHEQLARERAASVRADARLRLRASRLVAARRWQRRAERADMRARLTRAAVR